MAWEGKNNIDVLGKVEIFQEFFRDKVVTSIERLPVSVSAIDQSF